MEDRLSPPFPIINKIMGLTHCVAFLIMGYSLI